MSIRLHYAQHFEPDWKGGYFGRDSEAWDSLFQDRFAENGWQGEYGSLQYEVDRDDLLAYRDGIILSPREKNQYFTDYTNEQVAANLSEVLKSDDDKIRLEWF
jgi:hypothetical protein